MMVSVLLLVFSVAGDANNRSGKQACSSTYSSSKNSRMYARYDMWHTREKLTGAAASARSEILESAVGMQQQAANGMWCTCEM